MKIKKQELIELYDGLSNLKGLKGVKINYAIQRTLNSLKGEVEAIQKSGEPPEGFIGFEKERLDLAKEHAEKKNGEPVVEGNRYVIGNEKKFAKDFESLKKKYKKEIIEAEDKQKEYLESLNDKVEAEVHEINKDDLPDDITTEQMKAIYLLIKNDR